MKEDVVRLFQGVNHSTREDELIPFKEVSYIIDPENQLESYFGNDLQYIYYCPDSIPNYVYWNEFVWVDIWSISPEALDKLRIKEMIQQFTERMNSFKLNQDYVSIFNLVGKKPLFMLFHKYFNDIPIKDRYDIFRSIYRRSEYGFHYVSQEMWEILLNIRNHSAEWKKSMSALKNAHKGQDKITVYRGEHSSSSPLHEAWSWTLSYKTAHFFATRFSSEGTVYETEVALEDIADYLPYNGEEEVLIPPQKVVFIHEHAVQ